MNKLACSLFLQGLMLDSLGCCEDMSLHKGLCEAEVCLHHSCDTKAKHYAYANVYNVAMLFVHYAAFVASTDSLLCRVCGIHCSQLLCRSSCDQTYSGLVSAMSSTPDASQFLRADKSRHRHLSFGCNNSAAKLKNPKDKDARNRRKLDDLHDAACQFQIVIEYDETLFDEDKDDNGNLRHREANWQIETMGEEGKIAVWGKDSRLRNALREHVA